MKEIIYSIEAVTDYNVTPDERWTSTADGYLIRTNLQDIFFGIGNGQSCCEHWGHISSEEESEFWRYTEAELLDIKLTDTDRDVGTTNTGFGAEFNEDSIMFIDLETSIGVLQFAVYNEHNGYYGHGVYLRSNQLTLDEGL